jgi:hypothetical protein
MRKTTATVAAKVASTVFPALTALPQSEMTQRGTAVRVYCTLRKVEHDQATVNTVALALLQAGCTVKVYQEDKIYTLTETKGTITWAERATHKWRKCVVVEVGLQATA